MYDLLAENSDCKLLLNECSLTKGVLIQNLTSAALQGLADLEVLMDRIEQKRIVAANLNN